MYTQLCKLMKIANVDQQKKVYNWKWIFRKKIQKIFEFFKEKSDHYLCCGYLKFI